MKYAVIETGGKQYLVSLGQNYKIEKIKEVGEGQTIEFDKVLLWADEKEIFIGRPYLDKKVKAKVVKSGRSKKIIVFHYRPKTRYKKKAGHRQPYLQIQILG